MGDEDRVCGFSLPVFPANLIVALTVATFGFHFSLGPSRSDPSGFLWLDLPPSIYDRSLYRSLPSLTISLRRC